MDISNSPVLLTGANRGLGAELVPALLKAGAPKIYATARNADSLAEIVALDPERIIAMELDITNPNHIARVAADTADVKLLLNNAGVLDFAGALDTTDEEIERNLQTNFWGTFRMTKAFGESMGKTGGGRIVNVLTFLTYVSAPIFAAYNASKAASWSMSMSLRPYLEDNGVTISNVFPTSIDTDMLAKLDKDKDTPADVAGAIIKGIEEDEEDIYPMAATAMFETWQKDQKGTEKYFARLR